MIQRYDSDPNPFNHGTTSITYEPVENRELRQTLKDRMKDGWGLKALSIFSIGETGKHSNNFRVETPSGTALLKKSHINTPQTLNVVNRVIQHCDRSGAPVPRVIETIERRTLLEAQDGPYCLFEFIEQGEHFDGSREEIRVLADQMGQLVQALLFLPEELTEEVRRKTSPFRFDPTRLEEVKGVMESTVPQSEWEMYAVGILRELDESAQRVASLNGFELPRQVIHSDVHPHNVLFDAQSQELLAFLDFDPVRYDPVIMDIANTMHRSARTFGGRTERRQDIGGDIRKRAHVFLDTLARSLTLTNDEYKSIPLILQAKALGNTTKILHDHFLNKDDTWTFDLEKQMTLLREASLFEFS